MMASFRFSAAYRIAIIYAAIFAWSLVLLGAAIYYFADAEFDRQRNDEIIGELDRLLILNQRGELLRELRWRETTSSSNRFVYQLIDSDGKAIVGDAPSPDQVGETSRSGASATRARMISDHAGVLNLPDGAHLIVTRSAVIERVKNTIFQVLAVSTLAVFGVSAAVGLSLGLYLRQRLRPISATAHAIANGKLDLRVPVRVPGDEFDAAGNAVNIMLDRIARLLENLRQVSSDIAHDLRKPLMRLLVQTDRLGEVDGAEQRVFDLGDEMLMLFSGILRIAEVEGGGLEGHFARVDLSALMNDVAESFAPALADSEHTIEWSIEPDVAVLGNRELLAQMASNLLDNARIHTPPGTTIWLRLAVEGELAKLSVEDNGPGVPEDDLDKLFQRFFRTETSRTTPGNGLGLSLVAAVSQAHDGVVTVENTHPGLRILIRLPRTSEET